MLMIIGKLACALYGIVYTSMRKSILITKIKVLCSYIQHEYAGITNVYNTIKFLIYIIKLNWASEGRLIVVSVTMNPMIRDQNWIKTAVIQIFTIVAGVVPGLPCKKSW